MLDRLFKGLFKPNGMLKNLSLCEAVLLSHLTTRDESTDSEFGLSMERRGEGAPADGKDENSRNPDEIGLVALVTLKEKGHLFVEMLYNTSLLQAREVEACGSGCTINGPFFRRNKNPTGPNSVKSRGRGRASWHSDLDCRVKV